MLVNDVRLASSRVVVGLCLAALTAGQAVVAVQAQAQCATCANPSLPVGDNAIGASAGTAGGDQQLRVRAAASVISTSGDKLYEGPDEIDNYLNLKIDLWMVSLVTAVDSPWGQTLQVAVPYAALEHEQNFIPRTTDTGLGDVEYRLRQDMAQLIGQKSGPRWGLSLGLTSPTGAYVGAQKTNYLVGASLNDTANREFSIGRGVWWLLTDLDAWQQLGARTTLFGQVGLRAPVTYAVDNFGWGNEVRGNLGARVQLVGNWLSATLMAEFQARQASTFVPDTGPKADERQRFPNGGGFWAFATPTVSATWQQDWGNLGIALSARQPLYQDVIGQQLIQNPAYFLTISGQYGVSVGADKAPPATVLPRVITGRVGEPSPVPEIAAAVAKDRYTIVDYWATWCPPCVELAPQIEDFAKARSDVYVHKVNATTWEVADWKHYLPEVDGLPVIDIFGPDQKLVRRLVGEEARKFKAVIPPPAVSAR